MMKQRIVLLVGLTAVSLLILVSCTQPTTPEPTTLPTVVPTSAPTTAPDPTPTPTPTAEEQANQLLLNDGRFTTLLDELTQEIGRGLSDAEQAQVLALARALWLPGQLDDSDWLPDPAGVTLHWRPALDGREGPVVRVVEAQPDSLYAAGAVIFWQGERLLTLTPSQPGANIEYTTVHKNSQSFSTWVETDVNGQLIRFVDNTNPGSDTYFKWVNPQDLREDGSFSIFTIEDTDPTNGSAQEFWWTNGGEPVNVSERWPGGAQALEQLLGDRRTFDLYQFTDTNGQELIGVINKDRQLTEYVFREGQWVQESIAYLNLFELAMRLVDSAEVILPNEVSEPTRLEIGVSPRLVDGFDGIFAVLRDGNKLNEGIARIISDNMNNNNGKFTLPIYDPDTRTVTSTEIDPNTDFKLTLLHYGDKIEFPHGYGSGDPIEFGVFLRDGRIELVVKASPSTTNNESGVTPDSLLGASFKILGILSRSTDQVISEGKSIDHMWADPMIFRNYFRGEAHGRPGTSVILFDIHFDWSNADADYIEYWGDQIPWDKIPPENRWKGSD
jgi:hypothetical protein